jgi:hypothetical protein
VKTGEEPREKKRPKPVTVAIDSMIVIYAGLAPSKVASRPAELDELSVRSKLLLHQLLRRKATILLPAVAVSELLVPVPTAQRGTLVAALMKSFVCPPFDLEAAAIAADLWSRHREGRKDLQYGSRQVLRADAMIVSSARAAGATEFYTHDRKCRALASLVMTANDLPTPHELEDQFLADDIRRGDA